MCSRKSRAVGLRVRFRRVATATVNCCVPSATGSGLSDQRVAFSTPAFLAYTRRNLILVDVDYPQRKKLPAAVTKQNDRLAKQYDIERSGYPTVVLLDPNGKVLYRLEGYNGETSADMIAWVEKAKKKK